MSTQTVTAPHSVTHRNGTWLGRSGEQTIALKTNKKLGERVVATRWTDTGEVEIKHITGDAWRNPDKFVEHDAQVIPNGTDADIDAYIAARLS